LRHGDELELVIDEPRRGVGTGVIISMIVHALVVIYLVKSYRAPSKDAPAPPIARYVELIRQNPQFTEAPGSKVKTAPLTAPFSDANREAATPHPTGDKPTIRPGDGGAFVPHSAAGRPAPQAAAPQQQQQQSPAQQSQQPAAQVAEDANGRTFIYRPTQARAAASAINWQGAIREVGKVASLGAGQQSMDLGNTGGEKGFAKDGPISFETQWYDWGEYAASMVSRIRVNWYNNMPQIIQTGLKGVVFIRITIHRDGTITDVTILSSSGVPPYDFAAKKAIELSSPLNPLPKDFPNETERVTFGFFYNQEPPNR
jgi:TonB family protein